MKTCKDCGIGINTVSMYKDRCKSCNQKKITSIIRYKNTGCSQEYYDILYKRQSGCCAICNTHVSMLKKNLAADHCHETGEIRGLLCTKCNMGIGYFDDDVVLLESAISYLKKGRSQNA